MTYAECLAEITRLKSKWTSQWTSRGGYGKKHGDCPLVVLQAARGIARPSWDARVIAKNLTMSLSDVKTFTRMADGRDRPTPDFLRALKLKKKPARRG